jgi:taurine dioxygenase
MAMTSAPLADATDWTLRPIAPAVGMEIDGPKLNAVTAEEAALINDLFNRHSALLFRGQDLTAEELVRFSQYFGKLDEAPVNEKGKTAVEGFPEIYVVSNILGKDGNPVGSLGAGEAKWHTDMSYLENPPKASMLYAVEVPPTGGNTWLSGMFAALDGMPEGLRRRVEGKRIKHDGTYNSAGLLRQGATESDDPRTSVGTFHPIIYRHPDADRDALYLGRRRNAYIEGLEVEESEKLLDELWAHATQEQFTYSHTWRVGDVLMWDNRATLHRRDPFDQTARRYMLRTQISGEAAPQPALKKAG